MEDWVAQVNEFCSGPSAKTPAFTLEEILSECANSFAELVVRATHRQHFPLVGFNSVRVYRSLRKRTTTMWVHTT
jgi:hypothetical protein